VRSRRKALERLTAIQVERLVVAAVLDRVLERDRVAPQVIGGQCDLVGPTADQHAVAEEWRR
jgi:hypothetical protein